MYGETYKYTKYLGKKRQERDIYNAASKLQARRYIEETEHAWLCYQFLHGSFIVKPVDVVNPRYLGILQYLIYQDSQSDGDC
jgi:hypothetical protein